MKLSPLVKAVDEAAQPLGNPFLAPMLESGPLSPPLLSPLLLSSGPCSTGERWIWNGLAQELRVDILLGWLWGLVILEPCNWEG